MLSFSSCSFVIMTLCFLFFLLGANNDFLFSEASIIGYAIEGIPRCSTTNQSKDVAYTSSHGSHLKSGLSCIWLDTGYQAGDLPVVGEGTWDVGLFSFRVGASTTTFGSDDLFFIRLAIIA
jgi:hypothetical protein